MEMGKLKHITILEKGYEVLIEVSVVVEKSKSDQSVPKLYHPKTGENARGMLCAPLYKRTGYGKQSSMYVIVSCSQALGNGILFPVVLHMYASLHLYTTLFLGIMQLGTCKIHKQFNGDLIVKYWCTVF